MLRARAPAAAREQGERLARRQQVGVVTALAGVVLGTVTGSAAEIEYILEERGLGSADTPTAERA